MPFMEGLHETGKFTCSLHHSFLQQFPVRHLTMTKLSKPKRTTTDGLLWLTALPHSTGTKKPILWTHQDIFKLSTFSLSSGPLHRLFPFQNTIPTFSSCFAPFHPQVSAWRFLTHSLGRTRSLCSQHALRPPSWCSAPSHQPHFTDSKMLPLAHLYFPQGRGVVYNCCRPNHTAILVPCANIQSADMKTGRMAVSSMEENPGARVGHSLKPWEPEVLWDWDSEMANQACWASFPKAGVQSQLTSPAPNGFQFSYGFF